MPQPNLGSWAEKPGVESLMRRMFDMERRMDRLMTQRSLESAVIGRGGLTVKGGQIIVKDLDGNVLAVLDATGLLVTGTETVTGELNVSGDALVSGDLTLDGNLIADSGTLRSANYVPGVSGWRLRPDGTVEINDVVLRGGIIGDDALTNPLKIANFFTFASGYALGPVATGSEGSAPVRASRSITVPAGFTQAAIFATVNDGAVNSTGSTALAYSAVNVGAPNNDYAFAASADTPAGAASLSVATKTFNVTGLSGGDVISIQSRPFTSGGTWAAASINGTVLSGLVLFLR